MREIALGAVVRSRAEKPADDRWRGGRVILRRLRRCGLFVIRKTVGSTRRSDLEEMVFREFCVGEDGAAVGAGYFMWSGWLPIPLGAARALAALRARRPTDAARLFWYQSNEFRLGKLHYMGNGVA